MFRLDGKAALITGASGGIGAAIARTLYAQGAIVALSGTRRDALDARNGAPAQKFQHGGPVIRRLITQ